MNLKDKIQEFMLCLKGKIHRKILVTLKKIMPWQNVYYLVI